MNDFDPRYIILLEVLIILWLDLLPRVAMLALRPMNLMRLQVPISTAKGRPSKKAFQVDEYYESPGV